MLEDIKAFFLNDGWLFQEQADNVLVLQFEGDNGNWPCLAQVIAEQRQFVFYSLFATPIPPPATQRTVEFITRTNCTLLSGNFEYSYTAQALRFKTGIMFDEVPFNPALIDPVVYLNVITMDRFLPDIRNLIRH
jgi:hypothetical protein